MLKEFTWVEKYRPHTVEECILPPSLKNKFAAMVTQGDVPNLLLIGGPGAGKTAIAKAMTDEMGCDYHFINGSLKGNIDTLRNEISNFASSMSMKKKRKYVILDEADGLTVATQPALRNFMEQYSVNCGFILTANYGNKIIKELKSRCAIIDFTFPREEAPKLGFKFFGRVIEILRKENIKFDEKLVAKVINHYYPDFRRTINEIQSNCASGTLDPDILSAKNIAVAEIMDALQSKNNAKIREWAAVHSNNIEEVFRTFYDKAPKYFPPHFKSELITIIGDYQFKQAFVADGEINLSSFLMHVAAEASWK